MQDALRERAKTPYAGASASDAWVPSDTPDAPPPTPRAASRVGVGEAVARHPFITMAVVLLCAGAAAAAGLQRTPKYTSQASMRVTALDLSAPGALSGLSTASASLANTYALSVNSDAVVGPAAQRLHLSPGEVSSSVSGTAIPTSPVFTITAHSNSAQNSRLIANAVADSLVANVAAQGKQAAPSQVLSKFDRLSRKVHTAQLQVASAQRAYGNNQSAANARALASAKATLETLSLQASSLQNIYRGRRVNGNQSPRVQILNRATDGSSDRKTRLQIYVFAGLLLGGILGATLATMRANRRPRRRATEAAA